MRVGSAPSAHAALVVWCVLVSTGFLCTAESASSDAPNANASPPTEALKQELTQQVPRGLSEDQSAEIARRYGPSATPVLTDIIKDSDANAGLKGMASLVLAKTPGTEGRDAVIAYVRELLAAKELTREQSDWLGVSMAALGWMADEVSLRFLEEVAGRSYWEPPRVPPVIHQYPKSLSGDEACLHLRGKAMGAGLGNVPRAQQKEVLKILRRLKTGDGADMARSINFQIARTKEYMDPKWKPLPNETP